MSESSRLAVPDAMRSERSESINERRYLLLSAGGNVGLAVLGVGFAWATTSRAILLDALFETVYFVAALFALKVARLVRREDDDRFPYGYSHFEPLVNGVKGLLILGVSAMAMGDAVGALLAGGYAILAGPALVYAATIAAASFLLGWLIRRAARRTASPLLHTDAANWMIGAAISSCVLAAFIAIVLLERGGRADLARYVDPSIVLAVGAGSILVPARIVRDAVLQLLNRAPSEEIVGEVRAIVEGSLAELSAREIFVRVLNPGRLRLVLVHVVLAPEGAALDLSGMDTLRAQTLARLKDRHDATILDMLFTADRAWGAPVGLSQDVPPANTCA